MCQDLNSKVFAVIREKIRNNEQFTSVDITKAVRADGTQCYHHDVAKLVRSNVQGLSISEGRLYEARVIKVLANGNYLDAYLYTSPNNSPDNYTNINQGFDSPVALSGTTKTVLSKYDTRKNYIWQKRDARGKFAKM